MENVDKSMADVHAENERPLAPLEQSEGQSAATKQPQNAVQVSELLLHTLFQGADDAIFTVRDGIFLQCNPMAEKLLGCHKDELLGKTPQDFSPPVQQDGTNSNERARQYIDRAIQEGHLRFEWRHRTAAGAEVETEVSLTRVDLPDGPVLLAIARDISERKAVQRHIEESERRYRIVAEHTHDWEMWIGPDQTVEYVSPACRRISGYPSDHFLARGLTAVRAMIHPDDLGSWDTHMDQACIGEAGPLDFRLLDASGQEHWICQVSRAVFDTDRSYLGIRTSMREITMRKAMEQQLQHAALHDPLTGLANRTLCLDRINRILERSKRRHHYHYAVLVIQLDRYAQVNESLGHMLGDDLLVQAAGRISSMVRGIDTVSRYDGDSFVVILDELDSPREAVKVARRILDTLCAPFMLDVHQIQSGVNIGIVLSPAVYRKPEDLLQNASVAMRHAQRSGRDNYKIFTGKLLERAMRTLSMEEDLRRALVAKDFFLLFQPIISLENKRLMAFEALVRWRHPKRGVVPPAEFIPVAEDSGLIIELGDWVLDEACRTMAHWVRHEAQARDVAVSVNISCRQFSSLGLIDRIRDTLKRHNLPPRQLKLELTESTIMENADVAVDKLNKLRDLGIQLSIDDFGTGYSSMNHLSRFPLDQLKIDLSFVQRMHQAPEDLEIVRAIINLAHNLGLKVVAEGIEESQQHGELSALRCEYGQGYLFSRPVEAHLALEILKGRMLSA